MSLSGSLILFSDMIYKKCDISHFHNHPCVPPPCPQWGSFHVASWYCRFAFCFFGSPEQWTTPVHGAQVCIHPEDSSHKLSAEVGESQEPFEVHDQPDYRLYFGFSCPSHFPCFLSYIYPTFVFLKKKQKSVRHVLFSLAVCRFAETLKSKGTEGHVWHMSCESVPSRDDVSVVWTCPVAGVVPEAILEKKERKTINIACQVSKPASAWFDHLPAEPFITLCCALLEPLEVSRRKHLMTECSSRRNFGNSLTLFSAITSEFPTYAHTPAKKLLLLRHTKHIMWEDGLFSPLGGKVKNRESRKWEERQNYVRPPWGRFSIVKLNPMHPTLLDPS